MGFEATKVLLPTLLSDIQTGKAQLPEFQRDWVWDDQRIKDLLVSVLRKHPIGSVMLLESNNEQARFKVRPIEGVKLEGTPKPQTLVLDGQQRLTSLFQVLKSDEAVKTTNDRRQKIERWYYLDLNKLLQLRDSNWDAKLDWEEVVISIPKDRVIRNFRGEVIQDCSTVAHECAAGLMPLSIVFSEKLKTLWQLEFSKHNGNNMETWLLVYQRALEPLQQYNIPVIQLDKNESKEAICKVFEKVNTGGIALDVFELLTAIFAAEDFDLRADWSERFAALKSHKVLETVAKTDFLQSIALLVTFEQRERDLAAGKRSDETAGVSCKRKSILDLSPSQYRLWADKVQQGYQSAAQLLFDQFIFAARDLPYRTQLVPLAALLARLGSLNAGTRAKLVRWYWCGVLGELYGSTTETRFAKDLTEVLAWLEGGAEPATITDANFSASRLLSLSTRNSAAYKGINALLMRDGGLDFLEGQPINSQVYFEAAIDIHHIFPKAWCEKNDIGSKRRESVVNKTPIAAKTNRIISDTAPSGYLKKIALQAKIENAQMDDLIRSHVIDPATLRNDDFDQFFATRAEDLLKRIEQAMGKSIARDDFLDTVEILEGDEGHSND